MVEQKQDEGLFIGYSEKDKFFFPIEALKKHVVALGSSGSGKTVLAKVLVEECARKGIPAIVVDPQGDLSSLALMGDRERLAANNLSESDYADFNRKTKVTIFTPISSKGIPLCLNPLNLKKMKVDDEELVALISSVASSMAKLLGYDTGKDAGKAAEVVLYTVLKHHYDTGKIIGSFEELANIILNLGPKLSSEVSVFMKSKEQLDQLVRKIKYLSVGQKELLFQYGVPVNMSILLGKKSDKTQISVIYLNTLTSQEEKEFFLSILTTQLYQWMLQNPSDRLQALYLIDEIAPFMPAGSEKPMPKTILKLMFKQARKYGVGCIIATQNPGDIDYKAFAQFGTWAVGRLTMKQDQKKVELALNSLSSHDLSVWLPRLEPGKFIIYSPDVSKRLIELKVRWLYTKHQTMNEEDIKREMDKKREEYDKLFVKRKTPMTKELKGMLDKDENEMMQNVTFFDSIDPQMALGIAEKNRKSRFFSKIKKEAIDSFDTELIPYIKVTIRAEEKKLLGKKETYEHEVIFNAITGELFKVKGDKFKKIVEFGSLVQLEPEEIRLLKLLNKEKRMGSLDIASKLGVQEEKVLPVLKSLTKKDMISFHKKEKNFTLNEDGEVGISSVKEISSTGLRLKTDFIDGRKLEPKFTRGQAAQALTAWFDGSEVIKTEEIFLPEYVVRYVMDGRARIFKISGND